MRKHRYAVAFTNRGVQFPYEVIDSNRYGEILAQCRSRRLARLLVAALEAEQDQ